MVGSAVASSNTDYFNHDLQPHIDSRNTASTMQVMGESGVGARWPFFFWTPQLGSLPGSLPRDWLCPRRSTIPLLPACPGLCWFLCTPGSAQTCENQGWGWQDGSVGTSACIRSYLVLNTKQESIPRTLSPLSKVVFWPTQSRLQLHTSHIILMNDNNNKEKIKNPR